MIYTGFITDSTANPLPGGAVSFLDASGKVLVKIPTDSVGMWSVDTEFDSVIVANGSVLFSAPGFNSYGISVTGLPGQFDVSLEKDKNVVLPWMIAVVLAAVMLMNKGKRQVGKFGQSDVQTIFMIIGGLLAISTINKILQFLHLGEDPKDKDLNAESANPTSVWNPRYWRTYYPTGTETDSMSRVYADQLADAVYSSLGVFWDDEDAVTAAIHSLETRSDVSFLAQVFRERKGADLLTYLRNGRGSLPENGLSAAEVANLNNYVYSLPNS